MNKVIVTTSDLYHHLLPIFCHLFNKFWSKDQVVEIVGYKKPDFELPDNFTFHSLGEWSGNKKDFSNDLKPYFEKQDDWFVWLFEDTFIKEPVNFENLAILCSRQHFSVGRINLTGEWQSQKHRLLEIFEPEEMNLYVNTQDAEYRLSTQPSIWNKRFLLQYLKPDLSPWDFETQKSKNDGWNIIGLDRHDCPLKHNEGVTRHNIYDYSFHGLDKETLEELKQIIEKYDLRKKD